MAARQQQWMPFWLSLPMAGERVLYYREAVEINYILIYFIILFLTLWWRPHPTPSEEAPGGGVCSSIKTMALEGETAPSWWWCLCAVCFRCFTSKKPSEREFFVPAGTDLAANLLTSAKSILAGTQNSRSEGFLIAKHTSHYPSHHDGAVCLSSGMVSMDEHTPPPEASSKGVGRGRCWRV